LSSVPGEKVEAQAQRLLSFLSGAVVRSWCTVVGAYTYETASKGHLTIPEVKLRYLQIVRQK